MCVVIFKTIIKTTSIQVYLNTEFIKNIKRYSIEMTTSNNTKEQDRQKQLYTFRRIEMLLLDQIRHNSMNMIRRMNICKD